MKQRIHIESEIDKTLGSLDNFAKVKSDAFFYTRLKARMENQSEPLLMQWFFELPYLKPALFALFLAVNSITLVSWLQTNSTQNQSIVNATDSFIDEYELNPVNDAFLVLNEE